MEEKKNLLTYAGLNKLEEELHDLKVVKRKEVAEKIQDAREQGDLSENAEYDAAKDEQRDIEARIEEIEKILKNAEVVVEDEVDLDKISVGCKEVKLLCHLVSLPARSTKMVSGPFTIISVTVSSSTSSCNTSSLRTE